jgi:hypothetical protein
MGDYPSRQRCAELYRRWYELRRPMLASMSFSEVRRSTGGRAFYETDTSTFESLDDTKLQQIQREIRTLEKIEPEKATIPQPRDWPVQPAPTIGVA